MNIQGWSPLRLTSLISLLSKGLQESSPAPQFESINSLAFCLLYGQLSQLCVTTGKTIALTIWTFVSRVMFLLFHRLSRLVIAFLPRSNCLLISWLQSLSAVILEPKKEIFTTSPFPHSICHGEGNGNPLQCSCLENPRDGGAWWAAIYGVAQSRIQLKRLSSSSPSINGAGCYDLSGFFFFLVLS